MTYFFLFLLLAMLLAWMLRPWLYKWAARALSRRMEDSMRRGMGISDEQWKDIKRRQRESQKANKEKTARWAGKKRRTREPLIPREYAVDVEYTEIEETPEMFRARHEKINYTVETQVSDAEWEELK